jgi:mRNA interferase HigB
VNRATIMVVRTFAMSSLRKFWEQGHADAEQPLRTWYRVADEARWNSFGDVKKDFPSVDLVNGNKLVFNIAGNKYRLVCLARFGKPNLYVLWIGTHSEYDSLDIKGL